MNQPAFIYDTGAVTGVTGYPSTSYTPADVLQADELNGWSGAPASMQLVFTFDAPTTISCFAMAGANMNGVSVAVIGSTDNFGSSIVGVSGSAAIVGNSAAWRKFTAVSYRYYMVTISGAPSDFMLYHLVLQNLPTLPYMADGVGLSPLAANGKSLISQQGLRLGSIINSVERDFSLIFDQVLDSELATFTSWAEQVIPNLQPFFFVPDIDASDCYFGAVDDRFKWNPTADKGLHNVPAIPFSARYS